MKYTKLAHNWKIRDFVPETFNQICIKAINYKSTLNANVRI